MVLLPVRYSVPLPLLVSTPPVPSRLPLMVMFCAPVFTVLEGAMVIAMLIVCALDELFVMPSERLMRLPPSMNDAAVLSNSRLMTEVPSAKSLFGLVRVEPAKIAGFPASNGISQLLPVVQLLSPPRPVQAGGRILIPFSTM